MGNMEFRYAVEKDIPLILQFIRELAEYEKMADEVIATEALLKEWIFEKMKAEVIFVLEAGKEIDKILVKRVICNSGDYFNMDNDGKVYINNDYVNFIYDGTEHSIQNALDDINNDFISAKP